MNSRKLIIYVHLILASLYLPLLFLMPFTGSMYLLGFKGEETKTPAFEVSMDQVPSEENAKIEFFKKIFPQQQVTYKFDYIKETSDSYIFRPTSKRYFVAQKQEASLNFVEVQPSLLKGLIELHKGHGPSLMRPFAVVFAIAMMLTVFSGLYLGLTLKPYRKPTLISVGIGSLMILLCLF